MANKSEQGIALFEPSIPGLIPDRPIADLLAGFEVNHEDGRFVLNKPVQAVQRTMLQTRLSELDRVLLPISRSNQAQVDLMGILSIWLGGYTILAHADNVGIIKSYIDQLKELPMFAVKRAIEAIKNRTARKMVKGQEVQLDPDQVPSALYVYDLAKKKMAAVDGEHWKITRVLAAKTTKDDRPVISPERRRELAEAIRGSVRTAAIEAERLSGGFEDEGAEARRRQEKTDQLIARGNEMILREYDRIGCEPVYGAMGMLVSPALAKTRLKKRKATNRGQRD